MNILLIGPPGSGKGTQGERLAGERGVAHIASGDLLRAEVAAGTELGREVSAIMARGDLVGDDLILRMVLPRVKDAAADGGYVLDGFPRTVPQAEEAQALTPTEACPDTVIYLDVDRDELVRRILARAADQGRTDDNEETVRNRLRVFDEATRPLIDHYREQGLLSVVDGAEAPERVTELINAALDERSGVA